MSRRYTPLSRWLARRSPLQSFVDIEDREVCDEFGGWVSLESSVDLNDCLTLPSENLENAWKRTEQYVAESLKIINSDEPLWLDREEVEMIQTELGHPPDACCPIYIFSVGSGKEETAVYVGQTSSSTPRFKGGHPVLAKLHAERFAGVQKTLYQACVMLLDKEGLYMPLEWVRPLSCARAVLDSVEAILIHGLKPEFNSQHVKACNVRYRLQLHMQNCTEGTKFLNDRFVSPP